MKDKIHPDYHAITIQCVCGNAVATHSTAPGDKMQMEICSECHPFFTGKQKLLDSAGRVERFYRKYGDKAKNS